MYCVNVFLEMVHQKMWCTLKTGNSLFPYFRPSTYLSRKQSSSSLVFSTRNIFIGIVSYEWVGDGIQRGTCFTSAYWWTTFSYTSMWPFLNSGVLQSVGNIFIRPSPACSSANRTPLFTYPPAPLEAFLVERIILASPSAKKMQQGFHWRLTCTTT